MATTKKEELGVNVSGAKKEEPSCKLDVAGNAKSSFTRSRVNEQARRELMEKYKYGDKYHD